MGMAVLRTDDSRFDGLEDWPYAPRYTEVDGGDLGGLRIAHAEAGPADGPVMLLMHGEPSWSYLYRKMLPPLAAAGFRCLAPDLLGFGRSDKPEAQSDYSYERHVGWMRAWLEANGLRDVVLFCQDWGGLIGLRLVAAMPDRFRAVCACNTFLPTGEGKASPAFEAWRAFSQSVPDFDAGWIVNGGTARGISEGARAAYNAPFPDDRYKACARAFPMLVVTGPDMPSAAENRKAWQVLERLDKPFLTLFGDKDMVTLGAEKVLQARIPGAAGQPHRLIAEAGHFAQEDAGAELADALIAWSWGLGIIRG
jgi:haloalkane dehalogenase